MSNRIVQTNMQLLVNNDYEHASISMVGKRKRKKKTFVCWNYRCLLSLIVDEFDYSWCVEVIVEAEEEEEGEKETNAAIDS